MPFASFAENYAMYDVTPVENLFLLEYMPHAPGDFVRVYLYGLMLCRQRAVDTDLTGFARALEMDEEQVLGALRYWERKGLVTGLSDNPPSFQFLNVRCAMLDAGGKENPAYEYGEFNDRLQKEFENLLHPQQFATAMEWIEDLKLPAEVVLMMVKHSMELMTLKNGGKQRSVAYAFKALNATAMDWAKRGIDTPEAAQNELNRTLPPYRLARRVLEAFGQRRNPTAAEQDLAAKWLNDWHFTEEDVMRAIKETTRSANPSFAYLDGILARFQGGERALDEQLARGEDTREAVKKVLAELGAGSRVPTSALTALYEKFIADGFAPETVLRAAAGLNKKNRHAFEDLESVLARWMALGLTTPEAADRYVRERGELRALTGELFSAAGIDRAPTEADLDQTQSWRAQASADMLLYAAGCARGLALPLRSIAKRVGEWAEAGVATLEAARAFKRPAPQPSAEKAQTGAAKPPVYMGRNYDAGFFDDFFTDLDAKGEGDA